MYSISFYIIKKVPSVRMALFDDRENLNYIMYLACVQDYNK